MTRVRVVVWLDEDVLERLELLVAYREGGPRSRSAVVRHAVAWLVAREAVWICRRQAYERVQSARLVAEFAERERLEREQVTAEEAVQRALRIAQGRSP